jgi:hypothetical protein
MTTNSKLGIICLILAIIVMFLIDLRVILISGFLYYAYKLLYKKESPNNIDKILIIVLLLLFVFEIFLFTYSTAAYADLAESTTQA